eukprot:scaffold279_cov90-Cylindrotheca_fusiformis.AAC.1
MLGSLLIGVPSSGETAMLHGWSGVVALCFGIAMAATEPGEKVEESDNGGGDRGSTGLFRALLAYALEKRSKVIENKSSHKVSHQPVHGNISIEFEVV